MPIPFLLASILLQGATQIGQAQTPPPVQTATPAQATPAPAAPQAAPNFQTPMTVSEPVRLARTPKLDGTLDEDEWDPIAGGADWKGYFQWEPGKLHFAAKVATGNDLLISLDLGSNGWLVGSDNIEARVSMVGGMPTLKVRQMDATQVNGPRWVELPGVLDASAVKATSDDTSTTFELTLDDAGKGLFPMQQNAKISIRLDEIASTAAPVDPFLPRVLSPVQLVFQRAAALPPSLVWGVEGSGNNVIPGEGTKIRFTFKGDAKLKLQRFTAHSLGYAKSSTADMSVPFPEFDNKGRAFLDYRPEVSKDATIGYRIANAAVKGADGLTGFVEASYRIAPLVDISLVRAQIRSKTQPQTVHIAYYVKSNSVHQMQGQVFVTAPANYVLAKGDDRKFTIPSQHGSLRRPFDLQIPAAAKGMVPLTFKVTIGDQTISTTGYLYID